MSALPTDLQQALTDLAKNEADVKKLMNGLSAAQLNWQPRNGKGWSILQCLEHLTLANKHYLDQMEPAIQRARPEHKGWKGPFAPGGFIRFFTGTVLEPPAKFKIPAPPQIMPPSKGDPDQVLSAWLKSHDRMRTFIQTGQNYDLNSILMPNPLIKQIKMKVASAMLIMTTHERRHIWQAGNVLNAMQSAAA